MVHDQSQPTGMVTEVANPVTMCTGADELLIAFPLVVTVLILDCNQ